MSSAVKNTVDGEALVAHEAKRPGADSGNQEAHRTGAKDSNRDAMSHGQQPATEFEDSRNRGNTLAKTEVDKQLSTDDVTSNIGHLASALLTAENVQVDNFIIQSRTVPTTDDSRLDKSVEPSGNTPVAGKGDSGSNDKKRALPTSGQVDFEQGNAPKKYKNFPSEVSNANAVGGMAMGQKLENPYPANLGMQSSIPGSAEPSMDAALARQQFQQYQHQQMLLQQAMMPRQPINGPLEVVVPNGFKGGDRLTVEDPRDMRKYMITIPRNAVAGNILHVNVHMLDDGSNYLANSAQPNFQHGMLGRQMPYLGVRNSNAYNIMQQSMYSKQQQHLNQQSNALHKQQHVNHHVPVADPKIAAQKITNPVKQEAILKSRPPPSEGVLEIEDISIEEFSASQPKIDFEHEQRRLAVLEKLLNHHGIDFKANRLGAALRNTCDKGKSCNLNEIVCSISGKSKKIEFKLSGDTHDLMKKKGGGTNFADLVSTVLAHDIAIMEAPSENKKAKKMKCHLIPHKCGKKMQLIADLKTYVIAKVVQDNGKSKVVSLMKVLEQGKRANNLPGVPGKATEHNNSIDKSSIASLPTGTNMAKYGETESFHAPISNRSLNVAGFKQNKESGSTAFSGSKTDVLHGNALQSDGMTFANEHAKDMLIQNLSKSLELERARVNEYSLWIKSLTAENARLKQEYSAFYQASQANQASLYTGTGQQPMYKM